MESPKLIKLKAILARLHDRLDKYEACEDICEPEVNAGGNALQIL